jgi:hypothetical protein
MTRAEDMLVILHSGGSSYVGELYHALEQCLRSGKAQRPMYHTPRRVGSIRSLRPALPGLRPASSAGAPSSSHCSVLKSRAVEPMPRTCVLVQNWGYGVSRVRSPLFGDDGQRLGPIKQFSVWQAL